MLFSCHFQILLAISEIQLTLHKVHTVHTILSEYIEGAARQLQPLALLLPKQWQRSQKNTHSCSSHWFCPTVTTSALIAALVQLCSPLSPLAAILAQTAQPQEEKVPLRDLHNFLFFWPSSPWFHSLIHSGQKISKITGSITNSEICKTWGL